MTLDEFEKELNEDREFFDRTYEGMGWPKGEDEKMMIKERLISIERGIERIEKLLSKNESPDSP